MGSGMAPCHAWTIKREDVLKLCPQEFMELNTAIGTPLGDDWDEFAYDIELQDTEAYPEDVWNKWAALQEAFKKATRVGDQCLELSIGYYDPESGDIYDELEAGCFFMVEGVTCLSPPGEKFKSMLTESSWTVFG